MDGKLDPHDPRLPQAWEILRAQHDLIEPLSPDSNRLAFADTEFLLRRETRGIRFQLELLKPDLAQQERGSGRRGTWATGLETPQHRRQTIGR